MSHTSAATVIRCLEVTCGVEQSAAFGFHAAPTGHVPLPGVKLPAGILLLQGRHQHLAVSASSRQSGGTAAATGTLSVQT